MTTNYPRTVLTTASGRHVDLLNPTPADVSFEDIAEHLVKENRYNGATRGVVYSVADHLCRCVSAALADGVDQTTAAYVLLHDGHEYVLKDDTTPKKRAVAMVAEQRFGVLAAAILDAFADLTGRWDLAIHEAAGLAWPPPAAALEAVHHYDRVLLATEWRDLMGCPPPYDLGAMPLPEYILPRDMRHAKRVFLAYCDALLPALRGR